MYPEDIVDLIKGSLPDACVELQDLRGNGEHYAAYVESESFNGVAPVDQHRMVYKALQGHIGTSLRTVTLKTAPPAVYQQAEAR